MKPDNFPFSEEIYQKIENARDFLIELAAKKIKAKDCPEFIKLHEELAPYIQSEEFIAYSPMARICAEVRAERAATNKEPG